MTVYLSFGHDYMLHFATISETTSEFLQNLCRWLLHRWLLQSPFSGLIASSPLSPRLGWRMGEFCVVVSFRLSGLVYSKFQSYKWTSSTCRRQIPVPTWSVLIRCH